MTDPERLGSALGRVTQQIGIPNPAVTGSLFNSWRKLVGDDVSRRCSPTSLKEGVLKVRTDSAAWAGQMRYIGPEIARRINQAMGADLVREVVAWVGDGRSGTAAEGPQTNDRLAKGNPLPDPTAEDLLEAEKIAASVADEGLKQALRAAVIAARRRRGSAGGRG